MDLECKFFLEFPISLVLVPLRFFSSAKTKNFLDLAGQVPKFPESPLHFECAVKEVPQFAEVGLKVQDSAHYFFLTGCSTEIDQLPKFSETKMENVFLIKFVSHTVLC